MHRLDMSLALAATLFCASVWSAATPPPTNVRASEITAVDALTGSFVLEVRAVCSCLGKTPAWPVLTQQPNAYTPRSVPVYAAWFQLPCLQPARGPL